MITKRQFLATLSAGLVTPALITTARAQEALREVRIGYQKTGVLLVAKAQGLIEKRFAARGLSVKWVEFTFGPPLLEALNTGNIDYGYTGDAPPIFAQAARANLNYVAALPGRGDTQAILVPKESPIQKIEDLKGKKLAIAKASSAHNLAISVIESVGLKFSDVEAVYLPPAEAAAAFTRGAVDAWSIWDPFFALAELHRGARALTLKPEASRQNSYFLANKEFLGKHPDIVAGINEELAKSTQWAAANRDKAAGLFAEASGVELAAQERAVKRTDFTFSPITPALIAEQQAVADRFHRVGLIPKPIRVADIVWVWKPAA